MALVAREIKKTIGPVLVEVAGEGQFCSRCRVLSPSRVKLTATAEWDGMRIIQMPVAEAAAEFGLFVKILPDPVNFMRLEAGVG